MHIIDHVPLKIQAHHNGDLKTILLWYQGHMTCIFFLIYHNIIIIIIIVQDHFWHLLMSFRYVSNTVFLI